MSVKLPDGQMGSKESELASLFMISLCVCVTVVDGREGDCKIKL